MMPLELIGVLGLLYCFFMYCTMEAYLAKKGTSVGAKVREIVRESRPAVAITNVIGGLSSFVGSLFGSLARKP